MDDTRAESRSDDLDKELGSLLDDVEGLNIARQVIFRKLRTRIELALKDLDTPTDMAFTVSQASDIVLSAVETMEPFNVDVRTMSVVMLLVAWRFLNGAVTEADRLANPRENPTGCDKISI